MIMTTSGGTRETDLGEVLRGSLWDSLADSALDSLTPSLHNSLKHSFNSLRVSVRDSLQTPLLRSLVNSLSERGAVAFPLEGDALRNSLRERDPMRQRDRLRDMKYDLRSSLESAVMQHGDTRAIAGAWWDSLFRSWSFVPTSEELDLDNEEPGP